MGSITIPKIKHIQFIIKSHVLAQVNGKERGIILHILAYKIDAAQKSIDAVCLELGVFVEGTHEDEITEKFNTIALDIFNDYKEHEIKKMLKSTHMENFWALYREFEYNNAPDTIKRIDSQKRDLETLKEDLEKYKEKIQILEQQNLSLERKMKRIQYNDSKSIVTFSTLEGVNWSNRAYSKRIRADHHNRRKFAAKSKQILAPKYKSPNTH